MGPKSARSCPRMTSGYCPNTGRIRWKVYGSKWGLSLDGVMSQYSNVNSNRVYIQGQPHGVLGLFILDFCVDFHTHACVPYARRVKM